MTANSIDSGTKSVIITVDNCIGIGSNTSLTFEHITILALDLKLNSPFSNLPSALLQILSAQYRVGTLTVNNSRLYGEHCVILGIFMDISSSDISLNNATLNHTVSKLETVKLTTNDCKIVNSAVIVQKGSIVFSGITVYDNGYGVMSYSADVAVSGKVTFSNNFNFRGGALSLYSSALKIASGTNMIFKNNSANDKGGAIYIEPDLSLGIIFTLEPRCFYYPLNCNKDANANYSIWFEKNSAVNGGNDIYGGSLNYGSCIKGNNCKLIPHTESSSSNLSFSSDPLRPCICDSNGTPQCTAFEYIFISRELYPGEMFTLPVILVGWDFGSTVGVLYAGINSVGNESVTLPELDYYSSQDGHLITNNTKCTNFSFYIYSNYIPLENVSISISPISMMSFALATESGESVFRENCLADYSFCIHLTPIIMNISLISCPIGFILIDKRCTCSLNIFENCTITDGTSYFLWKKNAWIGIRKDKILYDAHCPFDYCNITGKWIDLQNEADSQCSFNRGGTLCGSCNDNYSLAIGSSRCIHCQSNNNLSLVLFFALAGFLLVFFVSMLNLTVTQGTVNGFILYSNVVWTYKHIFFSRSSEIINTAPLKFLMVFLAWVNLDFGIEICFFKELTAFWKTWMQFLFPIYIWCIAGVIIIVAKYSSRLTNLLGHRGVPVLATLFLLSYSKLLRNAGYALEFSSLVEQFNTSKVSTITVWSVDGNLSYFGFLHSLLFIAGFLTLIFLWLPYTFLLFLMQWLRRLPRIRCLNWIMHFNPVYDAYLAPFKHQHQYWFGTFLFFRGILQLMFTSVFAIPQNISLLVLFTLCGLLISYIAIVQPYKSIAIMVLDISFIMNLVLLSGFTIYGAETRKITFHAIVIGISTGLAFLQFCGIVIHAVIKSIHRCSPCVFTKCCIHRRNHEEPMDDLSNRFFDRHHYQRFNNALQVQLPIERRREIPTY